jgi:AraC family transcriptional regulator
VSRANLKRMSNSADDVRAKSRICAYRANLRQGAHRHGHAHLSLILRGSLNEKIAESETRVGAGMFAVREGEFSHQVQYGPGGTLIASVEISREQFSGLDHAYEGRWVRSSDALFRNVIASACRCPASVEDAMWDVLARAAKVSDLTPPKWLLQSRDRLIEEEAGIAVLAADAGVHRVHFSRAFARAFGAPPTLYRRQLRAFRAAAAAIDGKAAANSAYECGFADQSHMARVLRQHTGASYKGLRALNAEVTSVQE